MAIEVIAVIGAGGKTTALKRLAWENRERAVLLTTTTHIYPMEAPDCRIFLTDPTPEELETALRQPGIVCAGSSAPQGKLGILPPDVLARGIEAADLVVYEGDGAHRLPLKLHREGEPVILPQTIRCLILAGLSALGKPVGEVVHRCGLNAVWDPAQPLGEEELTACVQETAAASGVPKEKICVFLNQADVLKDVAPPMKISQKLEGLGLKVRFGSLRNDSTSLYRWLMEP